MYASRSSSLKPASLLWHLPKGNTLTIKKKLVCRVIKKVYIINKVLQLTAVEIRNVNFGRWPVTMCDAPQWQTHNRHLDWFGLASLPLRPYKGGGSYPYFIGLYISNYFSISIYQIISILQNKYPIFQTTNTPAFIKKNKNKNKQETTHFKGLSAYCTAYNR